MRANDDGGEDAVLGTGDPAEMVAEMLMTAADHLYAGSNLATLADDDIPQYAIRTDIHMGAEPGRRVGKKRAELDPAGKRTFGERPLIKGNAEIVSQDTRNQRGCIGEDAIGFLPSAEAGQCGGGECRNQKSRLHKRFQ